MLMAQRSWLRNSRLTANGSWPRSVAGLHYFYEDLGHFVRSLMSPSLKTRTLCMQLRAGGGDVKVGEWHVVPAIIRIIHNVNWSTRSDWADKAYKAPNM